MNTQPTTNPHTGGVQTKPGVSIPLSNEIAAVFLGRGLTHPETKPEARAEAERRLTTFDKFKVVYAQNTADEMNIVVPCFPDLECEMEKIPEQQLEEIAGGEIFLISVGSVGLFFAKIGAMLSVGAGSIWIGTVASTGAIVSLGGVMAGVAASALVVGAGLIGAATVATGLGVGIAAAVGAFDGGQAVNIGHSS